MCGQIGLKTAALIAVAGLFLAACQVIGSESEFVTRPDGTRSMNCESGLGNYALAYSTIKVTVSQDYITSTNAKAGSPYLHIDKPVARPDPKHRYCLKFLESAFSDDEIQVAWFGTGSAKSATEPRAEASKTALSESKFGNGLLALVVSKNVDRTGDIIRKLIRAIFLAVSGDVSSTFGRGTEGGKDRLVMTEQDVDPFDLRAMAKLNRDLHPYGFCITLGKYTHDINRLSAQKYCDNPALSLEKDSRTKIADIVGNQDYLVKKLPTGIYYRPKQPYSLYVYVRDDPGRGAAWELRKVDQVSLENISPIISLNITRRMFAENKVAFAFDNGNLLDYCLVKGSEVGGFINIPIDIIHGIVSLPAATITAEINRDKAKIGLFDAQKKVIEAQNAYIDYIVSTKNFGTTNLTGASLTKENLEFSKKQSGVKFETVIKNQGDKLPDFCGRLKGESKG